MTEDQESTADEPAEMSVSTQLGMAVGGSVAAFIVTKLFEKGYKAAHAALQARSAAKA